MRGLEFSWPGQFISFSDYSVDFRFGFEVFLAVSDACLQNHCKDPSSVRNHFLYGGGGGGADVHGRLVMQNLNHSSATY